MKNLLFIVLVLLFTNTSYGQDCIGNGWEQDCNQTDPPTPPSTNTPGQNNVPINDYIPLLALAAITIGGITFYRNQKQII